MACPTSFRVASTARAFALRSSSLRLCTSRVSARPLRTFQAIDRRAFSVSSRWNLHSAEMKEEDLKSLKVNQDRLMEDIHYTCQWGAGERWGEAGTEVGMSRLSLSDADKAARDWFVAATKALGCHTSVDAMGNIFAVRPGRHSDGPPTFVGSHLDTQPSGGRYDGILGVTAGVEMLRILDENWVDTEYPVGVVNWTNEEGARFPVSMVSSGVWAGEIPLQHAHNLQEVGGGTGTMLSELKRIGYLGPLNCSHNSMPMAAHFELHIEQGPILEAANAKVGIVKGAQAYRWFTIDVKGRDAHTGTTDFSNRADPLLAASKMILHSHRTATRLGALASTGILTLKPGSTNTVPGSVRFSLDIRCPEDLTLDTLEAELKEAFQDIAAGKDVAGLSEGCTPGRPCEISIRTDSVSPAVNFHHDCIACVTESASALVGAENMESLTREMVSGAGHDSVYTSKRVPTSMIFVPCRDGVSHNPAEYCSPEDCAIGANVLMGAVLRYDKMRAERRITWAQDKWTA